MLKRILRFRRWTGVPAAATEHTSHLASILKRIPRWRPWTGAPAPVAEPAIPRAQLRLSRGQVLRWGAIGFMVFFFAPYYLTCLYIVADPPFSALMLRRVLTLRGIDYEWRSLDRISPHLVTQVIASEDGRYCKHWGVDWHALGSAAGAYAGGHSKGGGSTISMQAAKNLYLWNRPAFLRKPFEIPLALYMDFVLGKRRLMEIYLNIVEWAPGVYGAEAAARHHFGKSAASLTAQEAAQLAAALPNPKRRDAGRPGPRVFAFAERIRARAARFRGRAMCVLGAGAVQSGADDE
jgi:monofunctional biosynthetic peptidoglycan transglycosylase